MTAHDEERFRPDYVNGVKAAAYWTTHPASEKGVSRAFEAVFSLAAPLVKKEFDRFAADSAGQRMLEERPVILDLLTDTKKLAAMPAGSFGRAYHDFMSRMNVSDAKSFASLARVDEICARLGWGDDVAWFVERQSNSHDLFHVLSGYGSDLAGEGAVIWFSYGQFPMPVLWPAMAGVAALRPRVGWRRWHNYLRQAHRRGEQAKPLVCVDYERDFPLPLEQVRRKYGITSIEEAHPETGLLVDYLGVPKSSGLAPTAG